MFTVRKSSNPAITPHHTSSRQGKVRVTDDLGINSFKVRSNKRREDDGVSTSSMAQTPMVGMGPNVGMSNNPITIDFDPLLTGFTSGITHKLFLKLFRDIYYHDAVAGSTVDLMSSLPFSEFSLGGVSDNKVLSTYTETLERLNMRTLPAEISVDYLVLGAHCSSLLYNKEKKKFTDIMPHDLENLTVEDLPFYSQEPIITVKFPDNIKKVVAKDTPRMRRLREFVGSSVIEKIKGGTLELDPLSTIFIPRRTFSTTDIGTSYYQRILPIYLIEKNLFRGTLVESARRQRGILHLTLGEPDSWEPTVQDLEFMTDLFMNADSDPLGAIIATRTGVMVEELRQGGDFWKVTDFADSVLAQKLRALGISEAFLSGDANYNTADTSLSVFMEMLSSYRDMLTRKLFYDRLFPLISMINGYTVNSKGKVIIKPNLLETLDLESANATLNDGSKLLIPTVTWSKQLRPKGDSAYYEILNSLTEKGLPVPLRVLAAAGGFNLDELLRQQDEDIEIRRKVASYMERLKEFEPKEDGEEGEAEASTILASLDPTGKYRSIVHATGKGKVPLLDRNFGEASEVRGVTKTGKPKYVIRQAQANQRINSNLVKAIKAAKEKGKFKTHTVPIEKR